MGLLEDFKMSGSVCVCVLVGDKGITSLEPQTIPHKHSLSQWEVYIICQFLSHEGASHRHEKREPFSRQHAAAWWLVHRERLA